MKKYGLSIGVGAGAGAGQKDGERDGDREGRTYRHIESASDTNSFRESLKTLIDQLGVVGRLKYLFVDEADTKKVQTREGGREGGREREGLRRIARYSICCTDYEYTAE